MKYLITSLIIMLSIFYTGQKVYAETEKDTYQMTVTTFYREGDVYGGFAMFAESFAYWSYRSPGDIGLTLVGYIYSTAFNSADFGLASAVGVTLLLLIMTVNLIQLMLFGFFKKESD